MKHLLITVFCLLFSGHISAQKSKVSKLSDSLKEVSGLIFLNDSILVAHNDGGNKAILYFLNLEGKIIHKVHVVNAKNKDWEDITIDTSGNLYIADIGNNENKRENLKIYKISSKLILTKNEVTAEVISFSYPDQKEFPPAKAALHFDAEAISFFNDSLFIFTKCRAVPFDGLSYCYALPTKPGKYVATKRQSLFVGKGGWMRDAITGMDIRADKCYLLTYNRILIYDIKGTQMFYSGRKSTAPFSQKEAIAIAPNGTIYLADEHQKYIGGRNLYKIILKD